MRYRNESINVDCGITGDNFHLKYRVYLGVTAVDTILVHGNLASSVWWEPFVEVLSANPQAGLRGRLLLVDWRGYGESSKVKSEDSLQMSQLGFDLVQIAEKEHLCNATLIGHSTGGLISCYAYAQQGPQNLFKSIVLLGSVPPDGLHPSFRASIQKVYSEMEAHKKILSGSSLEGSDAHKKAQSQEFFSNVISQVIRGSTPKDPLVQMLVEEALKAGDANIFGVPNVLLKLNEEFSCAKKLDFVNEVGSSSPYMVLNSQSLQGCNLFIVHGAEDPVFPPAYTIQRFKNLFGEIPTHIEPNAGHSLNVENPRRLFEIVRANLGC